MDINPVEPMSQLIAKLEEAKNLPRGPERSQKIKEAEELFAPAAEELSLLGGTLSILAERNQNGESLKSFMTNQGVVITPQPPIMVSRSKTLRVARAVKGYWDRKKGKIAIGMTLAAALFFWANQVNIKRLNDFIHDENLVGLFEDWLGLVDPEDEEDRETPLNWREEEDDERAA